MVITSCHFISAISPNESTHGVGLTNFEDENGNCETHNTYVIEHYNGMEIAAKVCGYVAPGLGVLILAWLVVACCKQSDGFIWGGKCIPLLMLLGCIVCQAVTFLLFQSELFCNNKDITKCEMGDAGFRSIQACLVYAFCFILFYCGPTPEPFNNSKKKKGGNNKKKKKKKKTEPGKNEDWTKEMYEARRKEKKAKSRGVSGRSKKEIFDEHNRQSASGNNLNYDDPESQYSDSKKKKKKKQSHSSSSRHKEQKYGDYVDTEPDGMDWSAYTPEQREVYYEKQRIKEREKKEEKEKMRQWEDDGHLGDPYSRRDSRGSQEAYSVIDDYDRSPYSDSRGGGADSRGGGGHQHEDSYYSRGDDRGYEDGYYSRGGDQSRGGHEDSYYSRGRDDNDGYDDKPRPPYRRGENGDDDYTHDNDYDSRGGYDSRRGAAYDDDYTQDEYTRGEDDDYTQDDADNSRAVERYSSQSNSRSRSSRSQHEDSYYSQDDSRYRDDIH